MTALTGEATGAQLARMHDAGVPLRWHGTAAEAMGLVGEAPADLAAQVLCRGRGPHGERLRTALKDWGVRRRTVSYGLVLSPNKTVSVLSAAPEAHEAVLVAHGVAVADALQVLEAALTSRRAARRRVRGRVLGIAGVEAQYYTADAADPNLHSHVIIAASAPAPDGKWRAINSGLMFSVQWIVSAAYQMCLGTELKARLSAAVGRPELTPHLGVEVNYRVDGHVPTAVVIAREERYDFLIYAESVLRRRAGKPRAARRRAAQARKEQARELGLN